MDHIDAQWLLLLIHAQQNQIKQLTQTVKHLSLSFAELYHHSVELQRIAFANFNPAKSFELFNDFLGLFGKRIYNTFSKKGDARL